MKNFESESKIHINNEGYDFIGDDSFNMINGFTDQ